jgi:1-acyl-sn-glycerol-3-phosphate acyltransferase
LDRAIRAVLAVGDCGAGEGDLSDSPASQRPVAWIFSKVVKWLRVGLAGLAFLGFWVGASLSAAMVLPRCLRWCGLLHFDPRTVSGSVPAAGYVLVANHPTLVDVAALSAAFGRLTCVAKSSLFRSPVIGHILRACAYVDGGGSDPFSGALVVGQAVERVAAGMPVLIFPEGTRSPEDGLRPFKQGAFEIACRANVPVLPVLIRCTPPALGKGRPWYDIPRRTAQFTVTPMAPLLPRDFGRDSAMMTAACENGYRVALGLAPAVSPGARAARS